MNISLQDIQVLMGAIPKDALLTKFRKDEDFIEFSFEFDPYMYLLQRFDPLCRQDDEKEFVITRIKKESDDDPLIVQGESPREAVQKWKEMIWMIGSK